MSSNNDSNTQQTLEDFKSILNTRASNIKYEFKTNFEDFYQKFSEKVKQEWDFQKIDQINKEIIAKSKEIIQEGLNEAEINIMEEVFLDCEAYSFLIDLNNGTVGNDDKLKSRLQDLETYVEKPLTLKECQKPLKEDKCQEIAKEITAEVTENFESAFGGNSYKSLRKDVEYMQQIFDQKIYKSLAGQSLVFKDLHVNFETMLKVFYNKINLHEEYISKLKMEERSREAKKQQNKIIQKRYKEVYMKGINDYETNVQNEIIKKNEFEKAQAKEINEKYLKEAKILFDDSLLFEFNKQIQPEKGFQEARETLKKCLNLEKIENIYTNVDFNKIHELKVTNEECISYIDELAELQNKYEHLKQKSIKIFCDNFTFAKELLNSLMKFQCLTAIDLNFEANTLQMTDEDVELVANVFKNTQHLNSLKLNLNQNAISDTGMQSICAMIKGAERLQTLSIELGEKNNKITDFGMMKLAEELGNLTSLESVTLNINNGENCVTDDGFESIIASLKNSKALYHLALYFYCGKNKITDVGVCFLAKTVLNWEKLGRIYLFLNNGENEISDKGLDELSSKIFELPQLFRFSFYCGGKMNRITDNGIEKLLVNLKKIDSKKTIINFDFNPSNLTEVGKKMLEEFENAKIEKKNEPEEPDAECQTIVLHP